MYHPRSRNARRPGALSATLLPALLAALLFTTLLPAPVAGAAQWQPVSDRQVRHLHVLPDEPPTLIAVSGGELATLTLPAGGWQEIPVPLDATSELDDGAVLVPVNPEVGGLWVSPRDPEHLFVSSTYRYRVERDGELIFEDTTGVLIESRDGGETWEPVAGGRQVQKLASAPSLPALLYAGLVSPRRHPDPPTLSRFEPGDREEVILALDSPPISGGGELAVDAADPGLVYATSSGVEGLYVSRDRGATWSENVPEALIRALVAHPVLPGLALAGTEGGAVWRTSDGGATWQELAGPATAPVTDLDWDPLVAARAYAVADGVPYATDDAGATWTALTAGLPGGARVADLVVDPADPSRLFASLEEGGVWQLDRLLPAAPCVPDETTLCIGEGGRFQVRVAWQDFENAAGLGRTVPLGAADTGAFWFFDEENLELVVKVLDGGPVNGFHWVFYGSLTNVPFTLAVTDTATGEAIGYRNPERRFASRGDTTAFPEGGYGTIPPEGEVTEPVVSTVSPSPCLPGPATLCLAGGRYRVEVEWADFTGGSGVGTAVPVTDDTGLFWFFRESNLELAVKVLDGVAVNDHRWVFYGSLTSVAFDLRVTDTVTGRQLLYRNPPRNLASRGDTTAFPAEE